jgi:hypothetical protein
MKPLVLIALLGFSAHGSDLKITSSAQKSSGLKIKTSGVPTFESATSKSIPLLKVGTERSVEFQVITIQVPEKPQILFQGAKKGLELANIAVPKEQMADSIKPAKVLFSAEAINQIPTPKEFKILAEPEVQQPEPVLKDIRVFTINELKMIESQIFLEIHKNYEMAFAIFSELLKDNDLKLEAQYFYADAARNLNLTKEFKNHMLIVAKESKDTGLRKSAAVKLAIHIEQLDFSDIKDIEPVVLQNEVDVSSHDGYNFFRAKYYLEQGNLGQVEDALAMISEKSKYYGDSLLIQALFNYRQGKVDLAEKQLEQILKVVDKSSSARSVAGITLARIYFQKNKFKEAFTAYLEVDKSHSFWMQAMIEQAWTQILNKDFEGAAGNMFPLHTDFFKNAFNAESYVVRTVAYLNLCQFGDASSSLQNLGRKYAPIYGRMEAYQRARQDAGEFYDTVRAWLQNPAQKEVDGIPRSVIVEWAKHPAFVNIQKNMNSYEDEINNFNTVTLNLIQREKDLLVLIADTNKKLFDIRSRFDDPKNNQAILREEEAKLNVQLSAYKYESSNTNRARNQVKFIRDLALVKLDKDKKDVRKLASETLQKRFAKMTTDLKELLEQNEVLQYEIYSGAGEHIRYQTASGEVKKDKGEELKVEKSKAMKWSFKGEIWEDEIGHFRSSLKSACAPDEK